MKMSENKTEDNPTIDFSKIVMQRRETPEDIEQKCIQLCKDYLGGVWLTLTLNEVEVKRVRGGFTNQLYYCAINEDKKNKDADVPHEVAIRFYQDKDFKTVDYETNERLSDTVIGIMVSENGIGPKLYGIFDNGQIQKYYKHKQFWAEEQKDCKLVEQVFQNLARIHAMEVPIKKKGNWIHNYFKQTYESAYKKFHIDGIIEKNDLQTLKSHNVGDEWQWLSKASVDIGSPVTFTHIDFRGSNIMVTEANEIVICDFEYSCYGFRGFDFGTIIINWGRESSDWFKPLMYAHDDVIKPLVGIYIEESVRLRGKEFSDDPRNSLEHIMREVKVFSLVELMFGLLFKYNLDMSTVPGRPFDKDKLMMGCNNDYKTYLDLKEKFKEQNVFKLNL